MTKSQKVVFLVVMAGISTGIYYLCHYAILELGHPSNYIYQSVQAWSIAPAVFSWLFSLAVVLSNTLYEFFMPFSIKNIKERK